MSADATTSKSTVLDTITKFAAVVASVSLGASLIYDWGFLSAIGISFDEIPTSIADHTRSALNWAPRIAIAVVVYLALELTTRRLEGGLSEQEIIAQSANPARTRRLREAPGKFGFVIAALGFFSFVIFGDAFFDGVVFGTVVACTYFVAWIIRHPRLGGGLAPTTRILIVGAITAAILLWSLGRSQAIKLYTQPPTTIITYTDKRSAQGTILRYFDKGVLFRMSKGPIVLLQWSAIDRIETPAKYAPFRGLLCAALPSLCHKDDLASDVH